MHSFRKSQTHVDYLIHTMFPESVTLAWKNVEDSVVVTLHYFGEKDNDDTYYCCANNTWWKFESHDEKYLDSNGMRRSMKLWDLTGQVDSPDEGAVYDWSESFLYRGEEFRP